MIWKYCYVRSEHMRIQLERQGWVVIGVLSAPGDRTPTFYLRYSLDLEDAYEQLVEEQRLHQDYQLLPESLEPSSHLSETRQYLKENGYATRDKSTTEHPHQSADQDICSDCLPGQ